MRVFLYAIITILMLGVTTHVILAVTPDEILPNPILERRARTISEELRCIVCQNQTIDDSEAGLAKDLRILVRERLNRGDTDEEIHDFIVARYGEFVLLRPRLEMKTFLLWGFPVLILLFASGWLIFLVWQKKMSTVQMPLLSDDEQRRLIEALDRRESAVH